MKTPLFILCFFLYGVVILAQDLFIKTINILETSSDTGFGIIADDDGYVVLCGSHFYTGVGGTGYFKTDLEGNKIWEFAFNTYPFNSGANNIIKLPNDNYFISGGRYEEGLDRQDFFTIVKFNGDTLRTITHGNELNNSAPYTIVNGNELLCATNYGETGLSAHYLLLKMDTSGQIISEYLVQDNPSFAFNQRSELLILPSGEYLLGITYQNEPQQIYAAIRKTDTTGNTIWERMVNNYSRAVPRFDLVLLQNGNFVVTWIEPPSAGTEDRGSIFVRSYNAEGDSLWQHTFKSYDFYWNIQDIALCANGDIIGCGHTTNFDITGNVTCWMFRLSAAGELLWIREYVYWDAYAQLMFLYGITEDPYGNIVATGYAVAPNEEGVLDEQAVLLKVNNMGCLSADCNDDIIINSIIGSTAAAVPPAPQASAALQLYPNPMQEQATLVLPNPYAQKPVTVQLFNASGQMALQTNSNGKTQVQINKGNLPAGIYICKAFTQNNFIGTAKLLLE